MVVSKDAFKIKALDHYAPELVTGWWMDKGLFTQEKGDAMQKVRVYLHKVHLDNGIIE